MPRNHGLARALKDPQIPCMWPTKRIAARHGGVLCGGTHRMCSAQDRSAARNVHCAIFEIMLASLTKNTVLAGNLYFPVTGVEKEKKRPIPRVTKISTIQLFISNLTRDVWRLTWAANARGAVARLSTEKTNVENPYWQCARRRQQRQSGDVELFCDLVQETSPNRNFWSWKLLEAHASL
jgi:hypothetical protein